ncbi:ATP-grasp domain-containing protein [Pelagophyceae sp. CCMP2097]|nr:ATP-grasp domain-containing protein [Pelagophyceae sp. CCMP2097]
MTSYIAVRLEGPDGAADEAWALAHGAVSVGREGGAATLVLFDAARGADAVRRALEATHAGVAAGTTRVAAVTQLRGAAPGPPKAPPAASRNPALDRIKSEGFTPLKVTRSMAKDGKPDAVVIVDPISTGARLAAMAVARGFSIVRVMSKAMPEDVMSMLPAGCGELDWLASYEVGDNCEPTIKALKALPVHILGMFVGCESGVECYDLLSERMGGFPTNGVASSLARRDKYPMGEHVRAAGLRAVKQQLCTAWSGDAAESALAFIRELRVPDVEAVNGEQRWCVLKPCKSAGTDGVYIAKSVAEAERRFGEIVGHSNVFGETNTACLVQEFMAGTEFVVDSVSVEGVHKCTAIWVYDKRPANGVQFVYYGMELFQSEDGKREDALVDYVFGVLDALGVRHGPSHAEVMWLASDEAPCLVEVGCRPHGGEGTFVQMVTPIMGYSQASVMLDAVEKPYRFHRLPRRPEHFGGGAVEICLVCYEAGVFAHWIPEGLAMIRALNSFNSEELKIFSGDAIVPTVDFLNTPGSIMLVHLDAAQLQADIDVIRGLEKVGLYHIVQNTRKIRLSSF